MSSEGFKVVTDREKKARTGTESRVHYNAYDNEERHSPDSTYENRKQCRFYFTYGNCRNGSACKFMHSTFDTKQAEHVVVFVKNIPTDMSTAFLAKEASKFGKIKETPNIVRTSNHESGRLFGFVKYSSCIEAGEFCKHINALELNDGSYIFAKIDQSKSILTTPAKTSSAVNRLASSSIPCSPVSFPSFSTNRDDDTASQYSN